MKDKIEAMARLDGYVFVTDDPKRENYWVCPDGKMVGAGFRPFPNYLDPVEGHGHIQRIIDGLGFPLGLAYYNALIGVCSRDDTDVWNASCEQKVEAVLRAKGAWDD